MTKGCDECGVNGGYALYCLACTEKFFGKGKEWVGLSEEEIKEVISKYYSYNPRLLSFALEIKAKLKEKNGYD